MLDVLIHRLWMDAPIRIVRLRETWSGACSDANGEVTLNAVLLKPKTPTNKSVLREILFNPFE
jgi:hypothetical protein